MYDNIQSKWGRVNGWQEAEGLTETERKRDEKEGDI